jgi:beta-aspartyl-dipeptidase (metallo-type)
MVTLVQGGHLYGPEDLGIQDLLVVNGKIERIAPAIRGAEAVFPELEHVNASGKLIFPGFIDQHMHIIGGGGSAGPVTRTKEVYLRDIVKAGTTTLVGTLGTDTVSRSMPTLLIKAKALNMCGIKAFIYTGSVLVPPVTLTGSVERDIVLISEIIGVKMGLGETVYPRPDLRELENLITETRRAGSLSRKQAVVHIHLAASATNWVDAIESILTSRDVPYGQVVLTHVNKTPRLLERCFEYAKKGGGIDLTTCIRPPERPGTVKPSAGLKKYLENGCPPENIMFSSDSNASRVLDGGVVDYTRVGTLLEEFRDCVLQEGIPLPQALAPVTRNPALRLGLSQERGGIRTGFSADLGFFTERLELTDLMGGGAWLLREGTVAKVDPLE